jgi:hypothetical protein
MNRYIRSVEIIDRNLPALAPLFDEMRDRLREITSVKVVEIPVWAPESIGQAACVVMLRSRSLSAASICAKASTCM